MTLFVLALAAAMYSGIVVFPNRKALIALSAAALLVLFGALSLERTLLHAINWNILLIYIGSLVLAELFIYSRVPAFLADRIIERSPTLGIGIVIIFLLTGIISAFVENVATVLVMAPIVLEVSKKLKANPAPFMIGLAVMANLQGTATLVGDPPSMIFAAFSGYSFNDFFLHAGKLSIFFSVQVGALVGALFFYARFRRFDREKLDLPAERIVSWVPSVLLGAMILGLALISFMSHGGGIHPLSGALCMALALIGLAWIKYVRREQWRFLGSLVKGLDWETILFLVGIFVVIAAVADTGVLETLAATLSGLLGGKVIAGYIVVVAISVLLSGFIDNVPYIIAMLPVADSLARSLGLAPELYMFGLLLGSCLGGNLTPFGASANVVAVGLSKKAGARVSFIEWLKIAGPFTLFTTLASAIFTYLIWK